MNKDRIIKNRIYVLIACFFLIFFTAANILEPFEADIKELHGAIIFTGLLLGGGICVALELIIYNILKQTVYKNSDF